MFGHTKLCTKICFRYCKYA